MNYIILMFVIIIFLVLIYLKTYKAGKENLTECLDINDKLKNISNIINRLQNPYKKTPINNKKRNKLSQE